jgi:lysophospholipase L1-like esterase
VLYQTWGRRGADFSAMNARLRSGYHAAAQAAGGLEVVPVGDAWEQEISAGRGDALFHPDGSHPTAAGNALTARVFVASFFGK